MKGLYILSHIRNRRGGATDRHARLQIVDAVCDSGDENEEDEDDEEDDNVALHFGVGLCIFSISLFDVLGS